MKVIEATQSGVDGEARWVRKGGESVFGYKQHTVVDDNGLVMAVETTAANRHDSHPMLALLDKAGIGPGCRLHADKAYGSQKHREALKARGIKNGSQARWFGGKIPRYRGLAKAHAWHVLQAMAYNLKRLPRLFVESLMKQENCTDVYKTKTD
jgi:IS5 family transposase